MSLGAPDAEVLLARSDLIRPLEKVLVVSQGEKRLLINKAHDSKAAQRQPSETKDKIISTRFTAVKMKMSVSQASPQP